MAASRLFSSSVRTLWVVVGVLAALVLAAMGATALAERGDDDDRDRVARYIESVNGVQRGLGAELARVNRTYAAFRASPDSLAAQAADLRRAERTLALLQQQVGALSVPEQAEILHVELRRLISLQIDFARELTQLGDYLPRAAAAERALAPAGARVRRELAAAETPEQQSRAFGRYSAALGSVADRLEKLSAPAVLQPARRAEIARLRQLESLGTQLRQAIDQDRPTEIERLADSIARVSSVRGATRAERDAVVAYNRRLRDMQNQRTAVERERARLDRALD
jgi:hypothetical protein